MKFKNINDSFHRGQAVIEYIFLLAFMSFISLEMLQQFGDILGGNMGGIAYYLTQHLTTGVCADICFTDSYANIAY